MYRSTNGGHQWLATSLPAPADATLGGISTFWGPPGALALCQMTRTGLHCSGDGGLSWKPQNLGIDPRRLGGKVVASGEGAEVFLGHADGTVQQLYDVINREFVSGSVYFGSGSDRPAAALRPFLERLGAAIGQDIKSRVRVEGHTDSDGSDQLNEELSRRRAVQVAAILESSGARSSQITTFGFGEHKPLFENTTAENKRRNRRVEILTFRSRALRR